MLPISSCAGKSTDLSTFSSEAGAGWLPCPDMKPAPTSSESPTRCSDCSDPCCFGAHAIRWGQKQRGRSKTYDKSNIYLFQRHNMKARILRLQYKDTWLGKIKSRDASLISANMFLNAAHPSSRELPAGTMMVLRFLLTDASETCRNKFINAIKSWEQRQSNLWYSLNQMTLLSHE